jgi:transposase
MLTGGQASDLAGFDGPRDQIESEVLIADKAFDADKRVRAVLSGSGKTAVIPPPPGGYPGRADPAHYDRELYKERHKIENFFSRLKDARAVATRYDKTARNFLSGVCLTATMGWIN